MGENNERLEQFVSWLSQTYFNGASPEQVVKEIQTMQGTEEGQAQLQQWAQEFQQATSAFKKGGKIDQLVERRKKIAKKQEGGYTYNKVINAPGDTTSTKHFPDRIEIRQTRPNGPTTFQSIREAGTMNFYDPTRPSPSFLSKLLYWYHPASQERLDDWHDTEKNHMNDTQNIVDKTKKTK